MLATLALGMALLGSTSCVQVELATSGRSAHGSAIMPESAPHLLIRALGRLPDWVEESPAVADARITSLTAAPAINVIPRRAVAVVDVAFDPEFDPSINAALDSTGAIESEGWIGALTEALGPKVEVKALQTSCRRP